MSDDNSTSSQQPQQAVDPVQQLLHGGNGAPGQPLSTDQRNERREALLKRQREAREKAQQISQTARANAAGSSTISNAAGATSVAPAPASVAPAANTAPVQGASTPAPAPALAPTASDTPVRENMVQQAVSFLSSPSVQSADEAKKTQFLEKKGLTAKEIELARARIAGTASASPAGIPSAVAQQPYQSQAVSAPSGSAPPPVPPRTYAPLQPYAQQPMYIPQQPQSQVVADPNAFKKKLLIAMLISGGVTVLTSIIVQKLIYPMVRGITSARQTLAVSQAELLGKLKEKLSGYKEYLVGLHLGSNRTRVKRVKDDEDAGKTTKGTVTTVEDEDGQNKKSATTATTMTTTTTEQQQQEPQLSTVRQLDAFQKKLESHADSLNFEQLKATRAMTQDLAEYITKETYALSTSIAYPTSRYYGYNTAGAAASGKGGLADPTTPESALKSEIRSLKGLLLNWRNFPVAKEGAAPAGQANGFSGLPNLVQQQ
ncbi:hypothetical protein BGZ72_002365 [Mortierella alpina]|nr:hypothetical protein BGZ72_002365 [Mortierella alpina]